MTPQEDVAQNGDDPKYAEALLVKGGGECVADARHKITRISRHIGGNQSSLGALLLKNAERECLHKQEELQAATMKTSCRSICTQQEE